MKSTVSLKYLLIIAVIISLIMSTSGIILATSGINLMDLQPNELQLSLETDEENNSATLKWHWKENEHASFDYLIEKIYDKEETEYEDYFQIFALPEKPIKVLNVSPNGQDLLHQWMEEDVYENDELIKEEGYGTIDGRDLIDVTTVEIGTFSDSFSDYDTNSKNNELYDAEGNYKYDIVVFGTADSNSGKDISENAAKGIKQYIEDGYNVVFGHDTIANSGGTLQHNNFNSLSEYAGVHFDVTGYDSRHNSNTQVYISKEGVFTSYPYPIGVENTILTIPRSHTLGQSISEGASVWLKFYYDDTYKDLMPYPNIGDNFYLVTNQEDKADKSGKCGLCAMIQTGHANGDATPQERQIFANLLFYLWYQHTTKQNASLEDVAYKDIDKPEVPTIKTPVLDFANKTSATSFSFKDKGTEYHWYVEAQDNVYPDRDPIRSNVVSSTRTTGIAKYEYIVDGNETADLDDFNDVSKVKTFDFNKDAGDINYPLENTSGNLTIDVPIGEYKNIYLHVRTIDGAGNVSEIATSLLYSDEAPIINNVSQDPTEWTNQNVKVTFEVSDVDSTIKEVKYEDANNSDVNGILTENTDTHDYNFQVNSNGTYKITAKDKFDMPADEASITISNIDKNNPEINDINVIQPTNTNQYAEISFSAEDKETKTDSKDISGISKIEIVYKGIDGTSEESVVGEIYTTKTQDSENRVTGPNSFKTADLQDADKIKLTKSGKYVIKVTDVAGNETISDEVEVKIESLGIKVKYQDVLHPELDDLSAVVDTKTTNPTALVGEEYTTKFEEISGYELVGISIYDSNGTLKETINPIPADKNVTIEYEIGAQTVVYEYKKVSKVTTVYEDANTNTNIDDNEEANYKEGDTYTVNPKDITGYVLTESPKETTGTMGRDDITKVYHYRKISDGLTVKYVDKSTGDLLGQLELKEKDGRQLGEGDIVDLLKEKTILEKNKEIEGKGYKNISKALIVNNNEKEIKDEEADITLTTEGTEVIYYYTKEITIQVVGIDEKTGKEIYSSSTLKGLEGENYKVTPPEIKGYKLDTKKMPTNTQGKYNRNDIKVVYYYNKIAGGVTVKYVDENNNEIAKREIIAGIVDEEYRAPYKDIDKYILTSVDGDTIGKMNEDVIDIIFHYKKKIGKVEVQYVDENGNILHKEEIENYVGEKYQTNKKDFKNYDFDGIDGEEEGYIEEGISTITYYYKTKQKDTTPKTGENNIINIIELITTLSIAGIIIIKRKLK